MTSFRVWPRDAPLSTVRACIERGLTDHERPEVLGWDEAVADLDTAVDALWIADGPIDLATASEFCQNSGSRRRAVVGTDGVTWSAVSRAAWLRFCHDRGLQDDASVYRAGAGIRAEYEQRGGSVPPPRQIYLGLTQRCDRSCTFCVSRSFDFDLLSMDEIRRLADELHGDVDVIALTGAGEAMTHPRFWDVMDLLCERFPRARYKMNTSGVSLARNAGRLLGYPIKNITVSLNAVTEENYRRFVGKGLGVVRDGIAALVEARAEQGRDDLRLCLSMVLMNSTLPELPDMVTLAFQLGVEEIQGIMLMLNDDSLAHESPFHHQEECNWWLEVAAQRAARFNVIASLPPRFGTGCDGSAQVASLPTGHGMQCVEVFSTVYLRPNGELTPCPYYDDVVGSLRTSSLDELWNGPDYERIRAGMRDGQLALPCRTCCGLNEQGSVDDYASHWLGQRRPGLAPLSRLRLR